MLKRIDDGLARGEAAFAAAFLLAMIAAAAVQVLVDNLALRTGVSWAHDLRQHLGWIDAFLKRSTVVLAFLGASLAVHSDKHIAIDVMGRLLPRRGALVLGGAMFLVAATVCYFLSRVFYEAALAAAAADAQERALDVYLLGREHVCDAEAAAVVAAGLRPSPIFCAIRDGLASLGVERAEFRGGEAMRVPAVDVPEAVFRFVVPVMLLLMAFRFLLRGCRGTWVGIFGGAAESEPRRVGAGP